MAKTPEQNRAAVKRHYEANREAKLEANRIAREAFWEWCDSLKQGPCTDCGVCYPSYVMEWDHLPGEEKTSSLADLRKRGNKRRILEEIAKCELVCANCHRIRTGNRGGWRNHNATVDV